MATITKSLTIESQGTYNLTFDLWLYSDWAASAGITTSYASLAALIADEKAVRQLMTVHASVDYFATCPDSTIISTVINNDLCAKWINLSDYAFDKLSAKSNIKSVMDTADKYGYGEWGKIDSTTWGALGNVPIMTANNAPYGEAFGTSYTGYSPHQAFDGQTDFWASKYGLTNPYIGYKFVNPICVKRVKTVQDTQGQSDACYKNVKIQGSNDGTTWIDLKTYTGGQSSSHIEQIIDLPDNTDYYLYYRLFIVDIYGGLYLSYFTSLQFYGRELTVKQASAPTDGREYIQIGSNYYTEDLGEKEFATGSTRKTIYDHGVEPSGAITGGTKNPDCLTLSAVGTATVTIDKGTRTYMGGKAGLHASGTNRLKCGSGYSAFMASNMPDSNGFDISSISGSVAVGIEQTASGTFDCTEIWIE